ncbi:MAG: DNA-binding protein [Paraburkholderia sp.]|jgi:DNA-binding protein H-NS|uniref:H-NS histone family protein n=1 Tax=Paraburkholderia sp. TaxID=1926495 RepID=UPI002AFE2047|nr:H-NS histone family protein [Paraburkholderia sp.]MEA3087669.1 DNA-binding protein [Paraburkholderia sp.]
MSSYLKLKTELAALDLQIDIALAREKAAAIREIQAKIEEWCIPLRDLQQAPGGRQSRVSTAGTQEPKYRDPSSRATWSGRGRAPGWLAGKDRTAFEIASPAS